jgi:hypothetical protein
MVIWHRLGHLTTHTRTVFTDSARKGFDTDLWKSSRYYMYHQFNIHKFYVLPTQYIYVFCMDLRTDSCYFAIQNYLIGLYVVCLLRGTDWSFKCYLDEIQTSEYTASHSRIR